MDLSQPNPAMIAYARALYAEAPDDEAARVEALAVALAEQFAAGQAASLVATVEAIRVVEIPKNGILFVIFPPAFPVQHMDVVRSDFKKIRAHMEKTLGWEPQLAAVPHGFEFKPVAVFDGVPNPGKAEWQPPLGRPLGRPEPALPEPGRVTSADVLARSEAALVGHYGDIVAYVRLLGEDFDELGEVLGVTLEVAIAGDQAGEEADHRQWGARVSAILAPISRDLDVLIGLQLGIGE